MISLVETGLMNALLAVGLAFPVLILARLWHRPALVHAFWILVLLKLVTPPLYQVQVSWQLPEWNASESTPQATRVKTLPSVGAEVPGHQLAQQFPADLPTSTWRTAIGAIAANCWQGLGIGLTFLRQLTIPALCVWIIGSICWFSAQGWRVVRFAQVFLRSAQIAPDSLQHQAQVLARQMGLKQAPAVWLLPAVVSPMLWSVGGKARILFPSGLLSRLDDGAVATLLTHELAHYRRGDHQVRMLEFLASGLFWWHPIVWVARRELEISEEQCCDAWVVSQFPASQRRYADALLATVDFLSEDHPPLPALASGLGDVPMLRQRLKLIMSGTVPKSLSSLGRFGVVLTALILIPISPSWSSRTAEVPKTTPPTASPSAPAPQRLQRELIQVRAAKLKRDIDVLSRKVEGSLARRNAWLLPVEATAPDWELTADPSQSQSRVQQPHPAQRIDAQNSSPREPQIWARATAPNGRSRVVAWTNGVVEWQRTDLSKRFDLSPYRISTILYSAKHNVFLAGCRDGGVRVWDASTCRFMFKLEGHQASVRALALTPDGRCLATADQQGLVLIWSFDGPTVSKTLTKNCSAINSLAFSADGQSLALGTGNWFAADAAQVQVWDLCSESLRASLDHPAALAVVRLSADGKSVSAAEWDGTLLTWDLESSALISKRQINRMAIPAAAFAPQS